MDRWRRCRDRAVEQLVREVRVSLCQRQRRDQGCAIPNALGLGFASTPGDYRDNIVRVGFNYRFGPRGGPGLLESPLPARETVAFNSDFLPNLQFATDRANMQVATADRARSPDQPPAKPVSRMPSQSEARRSAGEAAPASTQAAPRQASPRQVASAVNDRSS